MAKVYDITFTQTGLTGLATTVGESYSKAGKIGSTTELLDNTGKVVDTYMPEPAVETTVATVKFGTPITDPIALVGTSVTLMGTTGTCDEIDISGAQDGFWDTTVTVMADLTLS